MRSSFSAICRINALTSLPVVKYLDREHQADLRAIGCYYRGTRIEVSPWVVATLNGHVDTADYLASRDAGLDFHSACYLGDADFVNEVLKHDKGKTALHRASQAGFLKITELLLDHGADIEATSHDGETPLFDAAFHGRTRQLELLVDRGANVEARNLREETPLFAAVRGGQAAAVRKLTGLDASLDAVNSKGRTVGDVASRSKKIGIESVRMVLREFNRQGFNSLIRKKK